MRKFFLVLGLALVLGANCEPAIAGTLVEPTKDVGGFALGTKQTNGTTIVDNSLLSCKVTATDSAAPTPNTQTFNFTASAPAGGGSHTFVLPATFVGLVTAVGNCANAIGVGPSTTATAAGTTVGAPGAPTITIP